MDDLLVIVVVMFFPIPLVMPPVILAIPIAVILAPAVLPLLV